MRLQLKLLVLTWLLATAIPGSVRAQETRDPTQDLLTSGRRALDDLDYRRADSIAGLALQLPRLRRSHRIQALQLSAAARFPSTRADQQAERAMEQLRALVRFAPNATLPRAISWEGLDSLHTLAHRTTFGAAVVVRDSVVIQGFDGRVPIEVYATRPARYLLSLTPVSRPTDVVMVDSAGPGSQLSMSFQPVLGERPRFPSGNYRAEVTAIDLETGERRTVGVRVVLETPALPLHQIPVRWDSAGALPIRTQPSRTMSIISGLFVGGFTAIASNVARPDRLAERSSGGRSIAWGVGLGAATTAGSWLLDRGRLIPENARVNDSLQTAWAFSRDRLLDQNSASRGAYRGFALLTLEDQ